MNKAHEFNRQRWNEVTPVHVESEFYDVAGFIGGRDTLGPVERAALGDLSGKRVLHMQCHFGMDTLSMARSGPAAVVGLDFSDVALAKARDLAERTGLADTVRFVEADVTRAGKVSGGAFDVIYTSFGTIVWLEDLQGWADTIAANLAPGGFFYFLDSHPLSMVFDGDHVEPRVMYPYFHNTQADISPAGEIDYADAEYKVQNEGHEFSWPLQDIFGTFEKAGLRVHEVREYPFTAWRQFPDMEEADDGYWYRGQGNAELPLLLGFKAKW